MPVNPTRMNLINTKRSIKLARKGHSLLKRKREILVMEFLGLLKSSTKDRSYLQEMLQRAYKNLTIASTYAGDLELEQATNYIKEPKPIRVTLKNIMGVRIPEIERNVESIDILDRGYSLLSTSSSIDDVYESFNDTINAIVDVAKREQGLKRLVIEVDKVKRRVNALEYVVMPNLSKRSRYISMRLEEMDRDTFSGLKHVKKRLQNKAE
ncbi:MAG: V-type ATP synthase subunit D [Candidatus Micrarchaeota archaeon]|nr:V-type ATP synthase subunit D [Candidatus Micrarchaeota archaeon]